MPSEPGRLLLDIDYLVEWLPPDPGTRLLSVMVSPATLVFDNASDVVANIDMTGWGFQPSILDLEREGPSEHGIWTWKLNGDLFDISVQSRGFTQYLRREPVWSRGQRLSVEERGGLSFAEQGFSATPT